MGKVIVRKDLYRLLSAWDRLMQLLSSTLQQIMRSTRLCSLPRGKELEVCRSCSRRRRLAHRTRAIAVSMKTWLVPSLGTSGYTLESSSSHSSVLEIQLNSHLAHYTRVWGLYRSSLASWAGGSHRTMRFFEAQHNTLTQHKPPTNNRHHQANNRQPTNRPTDQPTNQPTNQPANQPTNRPPTNQPTNQPTDRPTDRPTNQPTNQPTSQPTNQPTTTTDHKESFPFKFCTLSLVCRCDLET